MLLLSLQASLFPFTLPVLSTTSITSCECNGEVVIIQFMQCTCISIYVCTISLFDVKYPILLYLTCWNHYNILSSYICWRQWVSRRRGDTAVMFLLVQSNRRTKMRVSICVTAMIFFCWRDWSSNMSISFKQHRINKLSLFTTSFAKWIVAMNAAVLSEPMKVVHNRMSHNKWRSILTENHWTPQSGMCYLCMCLSLLTWNNHEHNVKLNECAKVWACTWLGSGAKPTT